MIGSEFQERVWAALREIPRGRVATYGDVARAIGAPRAARAVARACGANPAPVETPCHRVVAAGGALGGYSGPGGITQKAKLLQREGITVAGKRIVQFSTIRVSYGRST